MEIAEVTKQMSRSRSSIGNVEALSAVRSLTNRRRLAARLLHSGQMKKGDLLSQ